VHTRFADLQAAVLQEEAEVPPWKKKEKTLD
jgi:hypothetical protein